MERKGKQACAGPGSIDAARWRRSPDVSLSILNCYVFGREHEMREKSAAPFVAASRTVLEIAKNPDCEDDIIELVDALLTALRRGEPKDDYLSRRGRLALADSQRKYLAALAGVPASTHAGNRTKQ
jgi:hypothetical protein